MDIILGTYHIISENMSLCHYRVDYCKCIMNLREYHYKDALVYETFVLGTLENVDCNAHFTFLVDRQTNLGDQSGTTFEQILEPFRDPEMPYPPSDLIRCQPGYIAIFFLMVTNQCHIGGKTVSPVASFLVAQMVRD